MNADGFGFGWFDDENKPVSYRQTLPAWSDLNLQALSRSLSRDHWYGYVRSATPGQAVHVDNTQPFILQNRFFLHNGLIADFKNQKTALAELLDKPSLANLQGDTDSAWVAALLQQQLHESSDIVAAIQTVCQQLATVCEQHVLLNFIIGDQEECYAVRHAINADCPTLYTLQNGQRYPDSMLIASEPFDADPAWEPVAEHCIIHIKRDQSLAITPLDRG